MNGLKILAYSRMAVKLLPGALLFLCSVPFIGIVAHNMAFVPVMADSAVGLGRPFSGNRTEGLFDGVIVAFSAVPMGYAMGDPLGSTTFIAGLSVVLALSYFAVSSRLLPAVWTIRKRACVLGGMLLGVTGIAASILLSQGRSHPSPPPDFHRDSTPLALHRDSKDLKQSIVVPTLDTPLPKGANAVWCGTIQLSWNRLAKDILREPPRLTGDETVVARLNQGKLEERDIPSDSHLAMAGFGKDGIVENVKAEMKRRFRKEVTLDTMLPDWVLIYAYLQANVVFRIPFFENTQTFHFHDSTGRDTEVRSFGIEEKREFAYRDLRKQIDVLHLMRNKANPVRLDEFIIDPCRSSSPNQIVLACVPPKATLSETLQDVEKKTQAYTKDRRNERWFGVCDVLLVPNLNWEVRHHFSELEGRGKRFQNAGLEGYYIQSAVQTICFKLDRSGAEVASENRVLCAPLAAHFVFDRPFLIYMKKRGGERPFFVMWVDNAELLSRDQ